MLFPIVPTFVPVSWASIFSTTFNATVNPSSDTLVTKFVGLTSAASSFRVTCTQSSNPNTGTQMSGMWFGESAASGDAMDFASSPAPVQVRFGGLTTLAISAQGTFVSDTISFAGGGTRPLMVAFQFNASATTISSRINVGSNVTYIDTSAAVASTVDKTGTNFAVFGTNQIALISKIEAL